jgi:hypothetical protein
MLPTHNTNKLGARQVFSEGMWLLLSTLPLCPDVVVIVRFVEAFSFVANTFF